VGCGSLPLIRRALAYQGDPATGEPLVTPPGQRPEHGNHLWDLRRLRELIDDSTAPITVVCGDARNLSSALHLFDHVVVLRVDANTLRRRLDDRSPNDFGSTPDERDLVLRLHDEVDRRPPDAVVVDTTRPVAEVVDAILALA
jgi:hypothetical protein